jgi:type VI secretion system ImpC/EvpB family protein
MNRTDARLSLIVLSPLAGPGERGAGDQRLHRVEPDSLEGLLGQISPRVVLDHPTGAVTLSLPRFRSFRPEEITRQLPGTSTLLVLRGKLVEKTDIDRAKIQALLGAVEGTPEWKDAVGRALEPPAPTGAAPEFRSTTPGPSQEDLPYGRDLANVLSMVDVAGSATQGEAAPPAGRMLDRLIRDLLQCAPTGGPSTAARREACTILDRAIADDVRSVLRHPRFRELESSWLGLRLLVRRMDFRSGIRLFVGSVEKRELPRFLEEVVVPCVEAERSDDRVPCVICDASFGGSAEDLGALTDMAGLAEDGRVPIVAGAGATLLGVETLDDAERLPDLAEALAGSPGLQVLRAGESSRWLTLITNRFLLRAPYGAESDPVRGFEFEENPPEADRSYTWGNGSWIAGVLIAGSFARTGWGTECSGAGEEGSVTDLPVRPLRLRTGEIIQAPAETVLSERRLLELSRGGLAALGCRRNSDQIFVATAPALHRPEGGTGGRSASAEARRSSLPYCLMVAQITAALLTLLDRGGADRVSGDFMEAIASTLEARTGERSGPTVRVAVEPSRATDRAVLRITPCGGALRGLPDLALEIVRSSDIPAVVWR